MLSCCEVFSTSGRICLNDSSGPRDEVVICVVKCDTGKKPKTKDIDENFEVSMLRI